MGYYSSRKPYYDLTKSQVEFFAGSSRFLKQSLVKESVMEKPYLEDEYQKMHLAIPPPIWPDPYPPWGPFGPIYGLHIVIFPPPSCSTISATNLDLDCGDVAVLTFRAYSFFEESWSWSWQLSSTDFPVSNISIQDLGGGSVALSTNVRDTVGVLIICGIGTAGLIPLVWEIIWEIGAPVPMLSQFTYTQVKTQDAVIRCCEEVFFNCSPCIEDPAMAWDYETSAETVAQDDSCVVAVTGLNQPFTWSVSGTGFTLAHTTTTGLTNTLLADASSCGVATITVTGCDGTSVTGYVRGAEGQWVFKGNYCGLGGDGTITYQVGGRADYEKILDNKKQTQTAEYSGNAAYYGCWDPDTDCEALCGEFGCEGCITWICTDLLYLGDCGDYCCYTFGSGGENSCGGAGSGRTGSCVRISALSYWEWEC